MAVQVSYPGVYFEELAPSAPIQGVGTSTAAFVGVALKGPLDEPTKITSWDAFQQTFGEEPRGGFFLWYAVRGFFRMGGRCATWYGRATAPAVRWRSSTRRKKIWRSSPRASQVIRA